MFGKDKWFAFEKFRPGYVWVGEQWRLDRRQSQDKRLGRRRSDAYFPYDPAFVVQSLAQGIECENVPCTSDDSEGRYGGPRVTGSGRYLKLKI